MTSYPSTTESTLRRRGRFLFLGGLALGIVGGLIIPLVVSFVTVKPDVKAAPKSGNITISLQDNLLTEGMRLALQQAQGQLPFTIASVQAKTKQGDDIELTITGQQLLGVISPSLQVALSPSITSSGQLDFRVLSINGVSIGPLNSIIETALNNQFSDISKGNIIKGLDYQLQDVHTITGALIITASLYQPS